MIYFLKNKCYLLSNDDIELDSIGAELKGEIKNNIGQPDQKTFEKYMKIYSKEELLTKTEFLEGMKIIQQRFETRDKRFEGLMEAMDRGFMPLT